MATASDLAMTGSVTTMTRLAPRSFMSDPTSRVAPLPNLMLDASIVKTVSRANAVPPRASFLTTCRGHAHTASLLEFVGLWVLSPVSVEHLSDLRREGLRCEGFGQELHPFVEMPGMHYSVPGVSRHKENREVGDPPPERGCHFVPQHAARQHDVG